MGAETKIQWAHHTFNIVWGCTKVSEGCANCYAEMFAVRIGMEWGPKAMRRTFGEKYWAEPLKWNAAALRDGVRRRVFCSSMADVFEDNPAVAAERKKLWPLIEATPQLDWLLLTKRPENVLPMMGPRYYQLARTRGVPDNIWLGFTAENQKRFEERWDTAEYAVRMLGISKLFISAEPLLERLDLERAFHAGGGEDEPETRTLDWIIVGGESGAGARPFLLNAAAGILEQCRPWEVPVFIKQLGAKPWIQWSGSGEGIQEKRIVLKAPKGGDIDEWPVPYRVRELPEGCT